MVEGPFHLIGVHFVEHHIIPDQTRIIHDTYDRIPDARRVRMGQVSKPFDESIDT